MTKVHKIYEPEFKEMIVRLVLEEGRTIKSVNEEYSLGEGTVRSWIKRFEEECASDPEKQDRKKLYEENLLLRKQLAEAKKENDFLIPPRAPGKSSHIFRKGHRPDQYQFIDGHRIDLGLRWLLRKMDICPNAYYNYRKIAKHLIISGKKRSNRSSLISIMNMKDVRDTV